MDNVVFCVFLRHCVFATGVDVVREIGFALHSHRVRLQPVVSGSDIRSRVFSFLELPSVFGARRRKPVVASLAAPGELCREFFRVRFTAFPIEGTR